MQNCVNLILFGLLALTTLSNQRSVRSVVPGRAVKVRVDGDVITADDVTLRVTHEDGRSSVTSLRRVSRDESVLHQDVTSFTVVGDESRGRGPDLRWETVPEGLRQKARQFFYNLDTGAALSIVHCPDRNATVVKGFVDHKTRIRPDDEDDSGRRSPRSRRSPRGQRRGQGRGQGHVVWEEEDGEEWRVISRLGRKRARGRFRSDDDDDDDDNDEEEDDDDDEEDDDDDFHKDDYLEVPAIFQDKSLWVRTAMGHAPHHSAAVGSRTHHHLFDKKNDDDDEFFSFDDKRRRRRRRRRRRKKRGVTLDMQDNPFHTTFSSHLPTAPRFSTRGRSGISAPFSSFGRGQTTGFRGGAFGGRGFGASGLANRRFGAGFSRFGHTPSFPGRAPAPPTPRPWNGSYVVEAMVMVDVETYSKFAYDPSLLEDYVLHFWQVVNLRLRAIVNPRLQLRIRSYGKILFSGFQQFIEKSRVSHVPGERLVSLAGVIEGFRQWMQRYETRHINAGHDVAVLMTGENLCKLSSNGSACSDTPRGIGYMGGACITSRRFTGYTYDVAVAEVDRSFRGVLTATHELGHLLNVSHDGEGQSVDCGKESGYIMSYSWTDAVKFNQFSKCSKLSMQNFLTKSWYSECLRESGDHVYPYHAELPGKASSLEDQCLHYNAGIPCSSKSLESQCRHLCCENVLEVSLSSEPAVDGTRCGNDKSCYAGQCLLDHQLPSL